MKRPQGIAAFRSICAVLVSQYFLFGALAIRIALQLPFLGRIEPRFRPRLKPTMRVRVMWGGSGWTTNLNF